MLTAGSLSDGEEGRDARSPETLQSLDAEVDAIIVYQYLHRAALVLAMYLWVACGRKLTIFFGHYSATVGLMVTDISASGRKSTIQVAEISNTDLLP